MEQESVRDEHVVRLLDQWREGDRDALAELTPVVYQELHRLAAHYMRGERRGHTLQATALVNEALMRLGGGRAVSISDSAHFIGITAKLMRHILIDHARARVRLKRGGLEAEQVEEDIQNIATMGGIDMTELDDALEKLAKENAEAANAMELHYFAGMTVEQTAEMLGVSISTVGREIRFAKAWLLTQLQLKK